MQFKNKSSGFTLLEILLVVGIISILAGIVIVAINPSKQLATVRNTERKSDIKQIDSALTQYYIDNFKYPASITGELKDVCDTGSLSSSTVAVDGTPCGTLINLSTLVPLYITAIPKDPKVTVSGTTGYKIVKDSSSQKVGVDAVLAELAQVITVGIATSTGEVVVPPGGDEEAVIVAGLRQGLVGYWPFNGNYSDLSGYSQNRDGNQQGSEYSFSSDGVVGQSLSLPGDDSTYVTFPSLDPTLGSGPFSISVWIKPYITGPFNRANIFLLGQAFGPQFEMEYGLQDGNAYVFTGCYSECNNVSTSSLNLFEGHWHHVAAVYDGNSNIKFYYDGVLTHTTNNCSINITDSALNLGYREYYGGNGFKGNLDEFTMWNRALTASEVGKLYNNNAGRSLVQ